MASSLDYVEYVCEQLSGIGEIRYRKMFGEYMVYVNNKPLVLICDDTAFVKLHPALESLAARMSTAVPYNGAKEHYVVDVDDRDLLVQAVSTLEPLVPLPKARKRVRLP
ncbi:MAG: TfoX/Sxy family protein [Erysipelotrichaceae bacterium]|jgi:TfoX/Sxy family transcriptional regulator of competence genes|nr:TfoX/Sxy family protein [Erysipelotrichaceae bacterium]